MLDVTESQNRAAVTHQRMRGVARVAFSRRRGRTRLDGLFQSGSGKAMLPKVQGPAPELVFLNTAGGLTGGDHLEFALSVGAGCQVTATTQTAERAYASLGDSARLDVDFTVGDGSVLHWLPQETILFDRANLARRTRIDLGHNASLLMTETLVLGRAAMGEHVSDLNLIDRREVYREGRPVFLDPVKLGCGVLGRRSNPALLGGAIALGTILMVDQDCARHLSPLRRLCETAPPEVEIAASAWDAKLLVRALATDAYHLRRIFADCLGQITGAGLPRVWQV